LYTACELETRGSRHSPTATCEEYYCQLVMTHSYSVSYTLCTVEWDRVEWKTEKDTGWLLECRVIPQVCPGGTEENNEKPLSITCLSAQHETKNVSIQTKQKYQPLKTVD